MNHPGDTPRYTPKHEKVESFSAAELRENAQRATPPQPESYHDPESGRHYAGVIRLGSVASQHSFDTTQPISKELERAHEYSGGVASIASERHFQNEDSAYVDTLHGSAGVFDGVGSDTGSNFASEAARSVFEKQLAAIPARISPRNIREYLRDTAQKASEEVIAKAGAASTTCAAAVFREDENGNEYIAWVAAGDSRLYRFDTTSSTDSPLMPLTLDHAWHLERTHPGNPVAQMRYQREVAEMASRKGLEDHIIFNSLGQKYDSRRVTTGAIKLSGGEKFVLFSDGVTDNLRDSEIAILLQQGTEEGLDDQQIADKIVGCARQVSIGKKKDALSDEDGISGRAKMDDISAVVITNATN